VALGTICAYPKFTPSLSRKRSLEWLPGRDERILWACEKDDAGSIPGLPSTVWFQFDLSSACKPLRSRGQFHLQVISRNPSPHSKVPPCQFAGCRRFRRNHSGFQFNKETEFVIDGEKLVIDQDSSQKPCIGVEAFRHFPDKGFGAGCLSCICQAKRSSIFLLVFTSS